MTVIRIESLYNIKLIVKHSVAILWLTSSFISIILGLLWCLTSSYTTDINSITRTDNYNNKTCLLFDDVESVFLQLYPY